MQNNLDNVDVNIKRANQAISNNDIEFGVGLINDSIDELKELKKKLGY